MTHQVAYILWERLNKGNIVLWNGQWNVFVKDEIREILHTNKLNI